MTGSDPSIAPVDDFVGNEALQRMRAQLAEVTARERGRGRGR